jgi:WD40 repeat protein
MRKPSVISIFAFFLLSWFFVTVSAQQSLEPITTRNAAHVHMLDTLPNQSDSEYWSVALSADGMLVAAGDRHGNIDLWETNTGTKQLSIASFGTIVDLAFSPDNAFLASVSWEAESSGSNLVHIWDTTTGEELLQLAYTDQVNAVTFSPDARTIATASGGDDDTEYTVRL